jgi:hypothetical protein
MPLRGCSLYVGHFTPRLIAIPLPDSFQFHATESTATGTVQSFLYATWSGSQVAGRR